MANSNLTADAQGTPPSTRLTHARKPHKFLASIVVDRKIPRPANSERSDENLNYNQEQHNQHKPTLGGIFETKTITTME